MIRAFIRFYFSRNVKNWRSLRKVCMAALPKVDQKSTEREASNA